MTKLVSMDTLSFERLPKNIQKIVIDGLDLEVKAGRDRLNEARSTGSLEPAQQASIEGDMLRAAELRNRFSPA